MSTKISVTGTLKEVPITDLFPDPDQPRQDFDEKEMLKLKESIEDRGIMSPITVEPKYKGKYLIVDGERRYRNALALKLKNIPVNVLSKPMDKFERNIIRFQLQETHKNWTPFEKAEAMYAIRESLGLTVKELARALAVAPITCDRYLSLLDLSTSSRRIILKEKMPASYIEGLAYLHRRMPETITKKEPQYIEKLVKKYKAGYIKSHQDFRLLNRIIKSGQEKLAIKYIQTLEYTAQSAYMDSSMVYDQFDNSMRHRAKTIIKDLEIAKANTYTFTDETQLILVKLSKALRT